MFSLTPEVPDTVRLPKWLNADGLARPDALEAVRSEASAVELELIQLADRVRDVLAKVRVVENSAYIAAEAVEEPVDHDLPSEVVDVVYSAVGVMRLVELVEWLVGMSGDNIVSENRRADLEKQIGYVSDWTDEMRTASWELVGAGYLA